MTALKTLQDIITDFRSSPQGNGYPHNLRKMFTSWTETSILRDDYYTHAERRMAAKKDSKSGLWGIRKEQRLIDFCETGIKHPIVAEDLPFETAYMALLKFELEHLNTKIPFGSEQVLSKDYLRSAGKNKHHIFAVCGHLEHPHNQIQDALPEPENEGPLVIAE